VGSEITIPASLELIDSNDFAERYLVRTGFFEALMSLSLIMGFVPTVLEIVVLKPSLRAVGQTGSTGCGNIQGLIIPERSSLQCVRVFRTTHFETIVVAGSIPRHSVG
jgi:hypothetical protein